MLDNPALRGKPVIVGGSRNRGVVSAASYEAREFGIRSAMPMAEAMRRCPDGAFLPPRMARYREVSDSIFAIFARYTPLVEPLSLDEAFLDVTACRNLFGTAAEIARRIKAEVRTETGLTVSAGVAASKLVAKIASDLHKPDGLTVVDPGTESAFLAPLPVEKLWGVGPTTRKSLALLGVNTIGDCCRLTPELLTSKFGKLGSYLYQAARGMDCRPVEPEQEIKSIGHEETFSTDLTDPAIIHKELLALAERVAQRLRQYGRRGRALTLKVKYADFKQISRSITLPEATDDAGEIRRHIGLLLKKTEVGEKPVRLLGITLAQLQGDLETMQLPLFAEPTAPGKQRQLNQAMDAIKEKFGCSIIRPGSLLKG